MAAQEEDFNRRIADVELVANAAVEAAIATANSEAEPLRRQLATTFGNRSVAQGTVVSIGPLGVLVTGECEDDGWLVTGTVTEETLIDAADELAPVVRPDDEPTP